MRRWYVAAIAILVLSPAQAIAGDCTQLQRYARIPFQTDDGLTINLPVSLAGFQTHLMLDTGAVWSVMRADLVEHLHLPTRSAEGSGMFDAAGKAISRIASVPDIRIGDLSAGTADFFVSNFASGRPLEETAGVLGRNALSHADLEIDNAGKAISLFAQDHCPGEGVYWTDEAVVLNYRRDGTWSANDRGSRMPRSETILIDMPNVDAELEGKPVAVLFDTGAAVTAMDWRIARRVFGLSPSSPGVVAASRVETGTGTMLPTHTYTFRELVISGIRFENVPVRLGEFGNIEQVILGMHEMRHLRMFFAYKEGRVYVTDANAGMSAPVKP